MCNNDFPWHFHNYQIALSGDRYLKRLISILFIYWFLSNIVSAEKVLIFLFEINIACQKSCKSAFFKLIVCIVYHCTRFFGKRSRLLSPNFLTRATWSCLNAVENTFKKIKNLILMWINTLQAYVRNKYG